MCRAGLPPSLLATRAARPTAFAVLPTGEIASRIARTRVSRCAGQPVHPLVMPAGSNPVTKEISLETRARQMMEKFRTHEWLGLAAGFLIPAGAEILRAWWVPELPVRLVHSWFLPVVGAASLLAICLSVSMHKALKERSAVDPLARREMCILFLLGARDTYGLRLMRRIAMAANVHALSFGMAIGLVVFSVIRI